MGETRTMLRVADASQKRAGHSEHSQHSIHGIPKWTGHERQKESERNSMKLLLTSAGLTNKSIRVALEDRLGKPIASSKAVYIPTAMYGHPGGSSFVWKGLREQGELGWQELGVLELTTLPSLPEQYWLPPLEAADVIWVSGGNAWYLSYWMQASGFAQRVPKLLSKAVYVGVSAGSMMVTHSLHVNLEELKATGRYHDDEYNTVAPPNAGSDKTLGLVDFVIRPHLNLVEYFPTITLSYLEKAAARVAMPMYAIDDQTAIQVVDGNVGVISEGEWKLFEKEQRDKQ